MDDSATQQVGNTRRETHQAEQLALPTVISSFRAHPILSGPACQPALTYGSSFLDQGLRAANGAPISGLGTEHLLMPVRVGESEIPQDRRFAGGNLAVVAWTNQASSPVDQVESIVNADRKEGDPFIRIEWTQSRFRSACARLHAVDAKEGAGVR